VPEAKLIHGLSCSELTKVEAVGGSAEFREDDFIVKFGVKPEVITNGICICTSIEEKRAECVVYATRRSRFYRDGWVRIKTMRAQTRRIFRERSPRIRDR
jgi:hypothetical protein